jgi:hypothetical protein
MKGAINKRELVSVPRAEQYLPTIELQRPARQSDNSNQGPILEALSDAFVPSRAARAAAQLGSS